MQIVLVAIFFLLTPMLAIAEEDVDLTDWAEKIALANMRTTGERIRGEIELLGHTPADVEKIYKELFEATAVCFVNALAEQTAEQDLPLVPILRGFANSRNYTINDFHIAEKLDFSAFLAKVSPCSTLAYYQAGLQPR